MALPNKFLSYFFVFVQFSCFAFLFYTGPVLANGWFLVLQAAAVLLGLWSLWVMSKGTLRIMPDVSELAILIRQGPYQLIRHPMYTAVLMFTAALVCSSLSPARMLIFIVLGADLLGKLLYEEKLLTESFQEYEEYRKKTWRLIPYIF